MKRLIILFITIFCLVIFPSSTRAEITWNTIEFDYSVTNLSYFLYSADQYYNDYNQYILMEDLTSAHDSVAEINVIEFENIPETGSGIQVNAMSKGLPADDEAPSDVIIVQSFLNTLAQDLNDEQGADIGLDTVSRIVQRFTVNLQGNYTIQMALTGIANFDNFYISSQYQAWYAIQTEIVLEQIIGTGDQMVTTTMPGFPINLSESVPSAEIVAPLKPVDNEMNQITYRIKCELKLKSRIDNLTLQNWTVAGDINGEYALGSAQAPFTLTASLTQGASNDSDQDGIPDDQDNCPNHSNSDQLDDDNDGLGNVCDGCASDPDKTEPGICGCGVPEDDTDSDDDGMIDCLDAFPDDPNEWEDSDLDGIGNNEDPDDDNDEMPDDWEIYYGLNPLVDDAGEDMDQDGWSNYQEYKKDTDPTDPSSRPRVNMAPIYELLLLSDDSSEGPGNGEVDCSEYMINGCQLPSPSGLYESIETIPLEGTYVNFNWSSVNCADGYLLAVGTSPSLIGNPGTVIIPCTTNSYRANFSEADEGSYYWAVSSRCNRFTSESGDYSLIQPFDFNL